MNAKYIILTLALILMAGTSTFARLTTLLKDLEENNKVQLKAYKDSGGVWTIGWGSINIWQNGKRLRRVISTDVITPQQADEFLNLEAKEKMSLVKQLVKVKATTNMIVAMSSLAYNIGGTAFANSTLLKQLNAGVDKKIVANQFDRWIYDNGVKVQGLINRRVKEKALFLK